METYITLLPASKERLEVYRSTQQSDQTCSTLMQFCRSSWPDKRSVDLVIRPYWEVRGELTMGEDLLLCGGRIVVPEAMQAETLQKLHQGHQGIQSYRLRAQSSIWWPGMSHRIKDFVSQCPECCRDASPSKEPLLSTPLPDYPWQKASIDLFELKGATYLLVVDYYSRFPEVIQLNSTKSRNVINALRAIFARYGIPETLISDNGPQYSSAEFAEFADTYGFTHSTSSPHYPQSNGHSERAVKTMKKLLKESTDQCLALLSYRMTLLPWCGLSPAELSQGRRLRSDVPQTRENLVPQWTHTKEFCCLDKTSLNKRKISTADTEPDHCQIFQMGQVWVTTDGQPVTGRVARHAGAPRSYVVDTPNSTIRRNRSQIQALLNNPMRHHQDRLTFPS